MIPLRWQLSLELGQRLMFAADVRLVAVGALVVAHRCVWLSDDDGIDIAVVVATTTRIYRLIHACI